MSEEERVEQFLKLLAAATEETGVSVAGCGCCGSPFLVAREVPRPGHYTTDESNDCLKFNDNF